MAIIDQKSDLKELKYANFSTFDNPPIVKDINNPPKYNRLSKKVTSRTDDALRMARLLTANSGKLSPSASNFLASQTTIATVNAINAAKKQLQGDNKSFPDTAFLGAAKNTAKTIAGILAQTAVSGTGIHFIFPPAVGTQYLQKGGPGSSKRGFLRTVGDIAGILSKDGIDGAQLALQGSTIGTNNDGKSYPLGDKVDETGIASTDKEDKVKSNLSRKNIISAFETKDYNKSNQTTIDKIDDKSNVIFTQNTPIDTRKLQDYQSSSLSPGNTLNLEDKINDFTVGKYDRNFSRGYKRESKDENGVSQNDERANKAVWIKFTGDQGKYTSSDPSTGRSAIDTFNSKGILDANTINALADGGLIIKDYDIIPFEFQIFDPAEPTNQKYLYFRAYLEDFSDDYSGEWNSTRYIGRAEDLYNYTGFSRNIGFSFKLAALTKQELIPIYEKLNFLVGATAPSYNTDQSFMRGVYSKVTVGDYLKEVPGFFNRISINWNTVYPWEIGYDENIDENELPRNPTILDISVGYTPVHNFNPALGREFIGTSRV